MASVDREKGLNIFSLLEEASKFGLPQIPESTERVLNDLELYEKENPRMRNVTRELGQFLNFLVRSRHLKNILELGSSNGYSTIWLASAAKEVGGKVTTVENQDWKAELAIHNLEKAELSRVATVILDDSLEVVQRITDPVDLLFMDIWPGDYLKCAEPIVQKMNPGGIIVVDNLSTHRDREGKITARGTEGDDYLKFMKENPKILTADLSIGSGVQIALLRDE